ncbi:mitochondrial carrier [Rhizodiscina lignyota]|uniref:Mitochondrial thiamine pyrophosphate carrier 1 n=1 Tax=Rhizodiscina lignyota TaxID=1504668 RepID=A0A9P4I3L7_9PEZI|nr:mitochondrial carrier [Rhizodiscina lignyota]
MDARSQDARLEALWHKLDYRRRGYLDLANLKRGLRKMDHPLKNADNLLKDVLDAMDENHDGRISYHEFENFVKQTEQQLWILFKSIDRNDDGKMEKGELKEALQRAGLAVPSSKLDNFFDEVDSNHDGVISFDEWRNFLLFIPATAPNLRSVLSYYSSTVMLNPEGDVVLSDETIQSIGTKFLRLFFGAIVDIAKPHRPPPQAAWDAVYEQAEYEDPRIPFDAQYLSPPEHDSNVMVDGPPQERETIDLDTELTLSESVTTALTPFLPNPGYFVAGAVSGAVSRTCTAPLDRLRVYLIAQIGTAQATVQAAKAGAPATALKHAGSTLVNALKDLWAAGGVRSLFAGNGLNVVKIMPESAIKFGSYEACKRMFARLEGHDNPRNISSWSKFVTGGLAGMTAQFAVYPLDTLKFRVQTETVAGGAHGNALIVTTARKMWRESGHRAFYRGLPAGLAGMFPYAAIDLGTFEFLKSAISRRNARRLGCHEDDAAPGGFATAAIGGFSGALGASLVYPLNLLRTRLQAQGTALHPRTYTGLWDVARKTVEGEGVRGLFKGLTPNLMKVVPAMSITYVVYENTKKALELP